MCMRVQKVNICSVIPGDTGCGRGGMFGELLRDVVAQRC